MRCLFARKPDIAKDAEGFIYQGNISMNQESPQPNNLHSKESRLADHILPSSATMIGVCMTVISLAHLIPKHSISRHVNDLLALDSLLFLSSAMLSYFSIRRPLLAEKYERLADVIFLLGLAVMVVVGFVVAFELMID
jgi:hypothetical protein